MYKGIIHGHWTVDVSHVMCTYIIHQLILKLLNINAK